MAWVTPLGATFSVTGVCLDLQVPPKTNVDFCLAKSLPLLFPMLGLAGSFVMPSPGQAR